jgi:molecular chaperone GrpE (heat shock protein)
MLKCEPTDRVTVSDELQRRGRLRAMNTGSESAECLCRVCERKAELPADMPQALRELSVEAAMLAEEYTRIEDAYESAHDDLENKDRDLWERIAQAQRDPEVSAWLDQIMPRYDDERLPDWLSEALPVL